MLCGCGEKSVENETTVAPTVEHILSTSVTFDCWGDDICFTLGSENEAFKSIENTQAIYIPDIYGYGEIQIDYIQGVSLNDFMTDYWFSYSDETKSELVDNGFTTDTECFKFLRTEKNNYIMIKGGKDLSSEINSVYNRFESEVLK